MAKDNEGIKLQTLYRHYKGGLYVTLNTATHTETGETLVIYASCEDDKIYARPLSMWNDLVNGVPRFTRLKLPREH